MLTDATGWNHPNNCEIWRSEWARVCNLHLPSEKQIDNRSFARQDKTEIPTVHEGADARKIEAKFQDGYMPKPAWKVEENQIIKRQNAILRKLQDTLENAADLLKQWKGCLNDIRRKQRNHSHVGGNDKSDRGTAGDYGRDVSRDTGTSSRKSTMERISGEIERREQIVAETERRIAELMRKGEQRKQSRERISIKKRIEANKKIVAEREKEREKSRSYHRETSR